MGHVTGGSQSGGALRTRPDACIMLCRTAERCRGAGAANTVPLNYGTVHGSSEGHELLKRNGKYHLIADDVPIPKM